MEKDQISILNIGEISEIATRLKQIGAEEKWCGNQVIITYDWSENFYAKQNISIELTQAKDASKFTVCSSEHEIKEVHLGSDVSAMQKILETLGFITMKEIEIFRHEFTYQSILICLCKQSTNPAFMEIQKPYTSDISLEELLKNSLKLTNYTITPMNTKPIYQL